MKPLKILPETGTPRIAFFGPMCSGKTYAAEHLYKRDGRKLFSFATPIKRTASTLYRVTGKTNEDRKVLQSLGDLLKTLDRDVFTKYLLHDINLYYEEFYEDEIPKPILVDDLRFPYEADFLKENGFILVYVATPEEVRFKRIQEKYPDTQPERFDHVSEQEWKNIAQDYIIYGDEDIEKEAVMLREFIEDIWTLQPTQR